MSSLQKNIARHQKNLLNVRNAKSPDSLVVRASALGVGGRGFAHRPHHTKGDTNGTGSTLADARNKRVVPGRYKKAGGYPLLLCRSKSSTELMLSVSKCYVK